MKQFLINLWRKNKLAKDKITILANGMVLVPTDIFDRVEPLIQAYWQLQRENAELRRQSAPSRDSKGRFKGKGK